MKTRLLGSALAAVTLMLFGRGALAAGFGIEDRSASQLGTANAGAAAAAEDASTIADNPAGIARLPSPELVAPGTFINPSLPFRKSGSGVPNGAPVGGPNADARGFSPGRRF